ATTTYDLSYSQMREFARNSLQYSFLPGARLFDRTANGQVIAACATEVLGSKNTTGGCAKFLAASPKAKLQWELEKRLRAFEADF
ncbi:MAG TPA: adenosine deaminase, partial [Gammaproteobacteria bacterium]|nr:adenosine deaminase [Gammaproteobacteria bacterium]